MISLAIDEYYLIDLKEDFIFNNSLDLYKFVGKDQVKAFYLGLNISDWFEKITPEQQYLYSKQLRHNKESLTKYQSQLEYWINKFSSDKEEIDLVAYSEYVLNNMFWEDDELDKVKMAIMLGQFTKNGKQESS